MCEEHYANSQAVNRKRPRDGRALCSIKGCPRLADGSRTDFMCRTHYKESNKKTKRASSSDQRSDDDNDEEIDERLEGNQCNVSGESEDEEDAILDGVEQIEDGPESNPFFWYHF